MMDNAAVHAATEQLTEAIRESEEYRQYKALKDAVMENETNRALLKEYQRTQTRLQMVAVAGRDADSDDVERFNKLSALLYMNSDVAQYLMAQMRMQQLTGEVFQSVAKAAELDLDLPGM
ncbi:MAG: YlbF family regulator [Eubacteriales bacterium]|nr:YlbF family regulator [Eubacteriales bacterium]